MKAIKRGQVVQLMPCSMLGVALICLSAFIPRVNAEEISIEAGLDLRSAVQRALETQPKYLAQRQAAESAMGGIQVQRGRFDPNVFFSIGATDSRTPLNEALRNSAAQAGIVADRSLGRERVASSGIRQVHETGLQWQTDLSLNSSFDQTSSLQGVPRQNLSALTLTLRKPLLRGNNARLVRGELSAAESEAQASVADTIHAASQLVLEVAQAYWQVSLQQRLLQIAREVELRAETMRTDVARLVRDGQLPNAERETTEALVQSRKGQRIAAEQSLLEAQSALAIALGHEAAEASRAIALRTDPLPGPDAQKLRGWLEETSTLDLRQRWDVRALEYRVASQQLRTEIAADQKRVQLDWVASFKSQGLGERSAFSWPGPPNKGSVAYIGLEVGLPSRNDAAIGFERQQLAVLEQYRLRQQQLLGSIALTALQAREGLRRGLDQVAAARDAASAYARVLRNENIKRRLGQVTLLNLINTETTYVDAQRALAQADQAVMLAVVRVAYEAGLLIQPDGEMAVRVNFEALQGVK